jgi:hypothetical protein
MGMPESAKPPGLLDKRSTAVLAPTMLEYVSARAVIRNAPVVHLGVAATRTVPDCETLIVVGLAGGLDVDLESGTVVVSAAIGQEGRAAVECDSDLVQSMVKGGDRIGLKVRPIRLVTADHIVTADERPSLAALGFDAVDMESARLLDERTFVISVRVILDTPVRGLSDQWLSPGRSLLQPGLWRQAAWLAAAAPRYAWRAARVVEAGLQELP